MILENLFLGENEDFTLRLFAALTSLLYPRFGLLAFYAHLFGLSLFWDCYGSIRFKLSIAWCQVLPNIS